MYAKMKKCEFSKSEVKCLRQIVGSSKLLVDQEKVQSMKNWPAPTSITELQQLLGFDNYYSWFIKSFAYISLLISKLLQQQQPWIRGTEQEQAFVKLKQLSCSAAILALTNFSKPSDLYIGTSNLAICGALMQIGYPIVYLNQKLKPAERNYSTNDQDFLAMFSAC